MNGNDLLIHEESCADCQEVRLLEEKGEIDNADYLIEDCYINSEIAE